MNLTTDPWIPIVWADGHPDTVSLCDAFARGEDIRDLAVRPHERIAVMRLLICIAQAALDGPDDQDDWNACRSKIAPAAAAYLKRWQKAFELFGDGLRFLQVEGLKKPDNKHDDEEGNSVSKLDLALATGNNSTLFDNGGGSDREFSAARLALAALTFQCFSPGGRIGVAQWHTNSTPGNGSSDHAPCIAGSMLHAIVRGSNFLGTIHSNLMSKEQVARFFGKHTWGKPVWEQMPSKLGDKAAIQNATGTYLGRFVPLSRSMRLSDDCRSLILANGLEYAPYPEWREPTSTVVTRHINHQPIRRILPASVEKAVWRELHALVVIAVDKNSNGGPATLENVEDGVAFDLWVGGLAANKAKLVDTTESVFHIPAAMLGETSQRVYEDGVKLSQAGEYRLHRAISTYRLARETNEGDLDGINRRLATLKKPERDRLRDLSGKATVQFWTDIEQAVPQLLDVAANPEQLGAENEWHKTHWGKAVWRAVYAAYQHACPHDTPRQMRAYALGLKTLQFKPKDEEEHGS
jgi:CRISPR system Cascade subunit CasA